MTELRAWEKLLLDKFERLNTDVSNVSNKLESLVETYIRIDKTLVKNTEQLATHIRRTDLAEKRVELIEARLEREVLNLEDKIDELHDALSEQKDTIKNDIANLSNTMIGWKANISLSGWLIALAISLLSIGLRFI